ncbi:MAG: helix-turn-helix transcriptional regulator [Chloroflexota bacterium]
MSDAFPASFTQLVLPSAAAMLYIVFGADSTTEITLPGTQREDEIKRPNYALILPAQRQWGAKISASADVVAVLFRPGMLTPFLNVSLHEFDEEWIKPAELWTDSVSNQLADIESYSPKARVAVVESILINQLRKCYIDVDLLLQGAVNSIIKFQGNVSLESLSGALGISLRQLRRKFQFHVGMTPKQLGRIERFRSASEFAYKNYPDISLASISQQFGYFDQAHFTRDVVKFTGQTPKALAVSDRQLEEARARDLHYFEFAAPAL